MKLWHELLILVAFAIFLGVGFNLVSEEGIKPFSVFGSDIDISHDPKAIINFDEVISAFEEGNAVFVDTRSKEEYIAGHIPGAISAPYYYMELVYPLVAEKVFETTPVILYGQDAGDISALRTADYYVLYFKHVRILYGGIEKWISEGLPLDQGDAK
ncbi:MAG: rhodanese-like domain-containing protein [Acidobacteria bacterium]|nr:rhodanese-like domain-containing protein [Acidobacteriota bacterium]